MAIMRSATLLAILYVANDIARECPTHLRCVLVSKDAMGDHEVLAAQMPGGVELQPFENQQVPARSTPAALGIEGTFVALCQL